MYHYAIALVLIIAIVFVEDIDVLYGPYVFPVMCILFVLNTMFICKENLALGLLFDALFVVAYVCYAKTRQRRRKVEWR